MRDVIQRVIASEAEAKEFVAAARAEAERIVSNAKREAGELTDCVRSETRIEAEQLLATAIHDAELEKQARLARAGAEIEARVQLDPASRQRAVAEAIRCVCGHSYPHKESP